MLVLYHSTTITHRYQAMLHAGNVRQTAGIVRTLLFTRARWA